MPVSKLFAYPQGTFLMLRLEFMVICQEELEAKLLRIIEMHVEAQRQALFTEMMNKSDAPADQIIEVEKDIWVPISHRLFINDLYKVVTSENTIKKALKSLEEKKLIFSRFNPQKRYDAPEYRLNTPIIQGLLDCVGNLGYQKLIPSIIDTLRKRYPQDLTPSGYQKLIPSIIDTLRKTDSQAQNPGGQNLIPSETDTNIRRNTNKNLNKKNIYNDPPEQVITGRPFICSGATAPSYDHVYVDKSDKSPEEDERPHLTLVPPPEEEPSSAPPPEPEPTAHTGVKPLNAEQIIAEWLALTHAKRATDKMRTHTAKLVEKDIIPGELAECREWLLEESDKKNFFAEKCNGSVHLGSIVQFLDDYRAAMIAKAAEQNVLEGEAPRPPDEMHDQLEPGMTEAVRDQLVEEILSHNDKIIIGRKQENGLHYLALKIGKNWVPIDKPRDWYYMHQSLVDQAISYGEYLYNKKLQQQESEKTHDQTN